MQNFSKKQESGSKEICPPVFSNFICNIHNASIIFLEKHLITFTVVILITVGSFIIVAVSLTATPAKWIIFTTFTIRIQFLRAFYKSRIYPMLIDYIYPICVKITEEIFVKNIEITWINTAIAFYNKLNTSISQQPTLLRWHIGVHWNNIIKQANTSIHPSLHFFQPAIIERFIKACEQLWCQRKRIFFLI